MIETSFGGFIVTFNRPLVLEKTIESIFRQSFCPKKIWIIDNSENRETENFINALNDTRLVYYKVGYNAGPAYAVNIGLELVAKGGFQWCFWGDDNDPPPSSNCFEIQFRTLLKYANNHQVGFLGIVGHRFKKRIGVIDRISNEELEISDYVIVDSIAGGQCKIVNTDLWKAGVRISDELFYGFEELDFDIQAKEKGYVGLVPTSITPVCVPTDRNLTDQKVSRQAIGHRIE